MMRRIFVATMRVTRGVEDLDNLSNVCRTDSQPSGTSSGHGVGGKVVLNAPEDRPPVLGNKVAVELFQRASHDVIVSATYRLRTRDEREGQHETDGIGNDRAVGCGEGAHGAIIPSNIGGGKTSSRPAWSSIATTTSTNAYNAQARGTAAARALGQRAAASGEVDHVIAHTRPGPNASTGVLVSLGFEHVADQEDPEVGTVWEWRWTRLLAE